MYPFDPSTYIPLQCAYDQFMIISTMVNIVRGKGPLLFYTYTSISSENEIRHYPWCKNCDGATVY